MKDFQLLNLINIIIFLLLFFITLDVGVLHAHRLIPLGLEIND